MRLHLNLSWNDNTLIYVTLSKCHLLLTQGEMNTFHYVFHALLACNNEVFWLITEAREPNGTFVGSEISVLE